MRWIQSSLRSRKPCSRNYPRSCGSGPTSPTANSQFATAATAAGLGAQPGMSALKGEYRQALEVRRPTRFSGSVDLDEALRDSEPQAARWDN